MPANFERRRFYQCVCTGSKADPNRTDYAIACPDGMGLVTCRQVFPGVEFSINDFRAHRCLECYDGDKLFQLDFCCAGRFECAFSPQEHCILAPGDLAVHCCVEQSDTESAFPLGYYQGVNLTIDCQRAAAFSSRHFGALAPDFRALQDRLLDGRWFGVRRADQKCAAIFRELFTAAIDEPSQFLGLKLLELFWLLDHMPLDDSVPSYFPKAQIDLVKRIRDHLESAPENYVSVDALSQKYQISVSQLQKVFKQLYGVPIYQYVRERRLERAAAALRETSWTVTEIALDAGFANPGKFAESFRKRYGLTPTQFRAAQKWNTEIEQSC